MITIIHGSDIALSRKYFYDEKQKKSDTVLWDADKVTLTDLAQLFDGGNLFGETKYLFIEQLLTKRKKSSEFTSILSSLEKYADGHTIILWEGKELDRASINLFKNAVVKDFKLPQTLFQLMDTIRPEKGEMLISLFHQTIKTTETEMVFFMLIRQFRLLIALTGNGDTENTQQIDEIKRMAPWQKNKLKKQMQLFKPEQLLNLYHKLFQIEVGQKTGGLTLSLISAIDFFLLEV
ncbi:MAG TPA: hypothetical protein VNW29_01160 [Candidatus Sulfotelmatobacter sp.]|jgi:hypothetical protein|nr:hypothetical protein [Candidatus Sulfotelmatobacter sp.]